jgi:hypothetical protein
MANMLDLDRRVSGIVDKPVIGRVDDDPHRQAVDDRCRKIPRVFGLDLHHLLAGLIVGRT